MTTRLVIIGAGGSGREVADVLEAVNAARPDTFELVGFIADGEPDLDLLGAYDAKHLGPTDHLEMLPADVQYVIGIGAGEARGRIDSYGQSLGRTCPVLIHPAATVARQATFGPGTVIAAQAALMNHVTTGRHVHIGLGCTVGHDVRLGDYVTLSPQTGLSGNVTAGTGAFFGTGAVVNPKVTIGAGVRVGSGAAVIHDVPDGLTVVGVPASSR